MKTCSQCGKPHNTSKGTLCSKCRVSRRKNIARVCNCGAVEGMGDAKFTGTNAYCNKCKYQKFKESNKAAYNKRYVEDESFREARRANRRIISRNARLARKASGKSTPMSIRTWLWIKTHNTLSNRANYEKKRGRTYEYNITLDYLVELWDKQQGRCALTGIPMTRAFNCPYSGSIDRIDSQQGYIVGNVQLLCQSINLAKNKFQNELMKKFIQDIKDNQYDNTSITGTNQEEHAVGEDRRERL